MAGKSTQETPHLRVRIEPRLLARLEKAREMNGRTLTGEIVERLQESFRREDQQALITATISRTLQWLSALPDHSLLKLAKDLPPEELDRFLHSLVTDPKKDSLLSLLTPKKDSLLSLLTEPKEDSK